MAMQTFGMLSNNMFILALNSVFYVIAALFFMNGIRRNNSPSYVVGIALMLIGIIYTYNWFIAG